MIKRCLRALWLSASLWALAIDVHADALQDARIEVERNAVIQANFRHWFEGAFFDRGPRGFFFVSVLRALRDEFGFTFDLAAVISEIPKAQAMHYGLHASDTSTGEVPPEARALFEAAPERALGPFIGMFADAFAFYCKPTAYDENEHVAARLVTAESQESVSFRIFDFVQRLHDAGCIDAAAYTRFAAVLVPRIQTSFQNLKPADQVLALFVLQRARAATPFVFARVTELAQETARHLGAPPNPLFGRRDVSLAWAYLLAHALVNDDPAPRRLAMAKAISRLRVQGLIVADSPLANSTAQMIVPAHLFQPRRDTGTSSKNLQQSSCQCTPLVQETP